MASKNALKAANTQDLEVGAVCKLKSGGERMTIELINPDGVRVCVWMKPNGDIEAKGFKPTSLSVA